MQLAYTILYVDDVPKTLELWNKAFGLEIDHSDEDGLYGELNTGDTTLAFAEKEFGKSHFEDSATHAIFEGPPRRFEIGLVTPEVDAAFERACKAGMTCVRAPVRQAWGQRVAWLSDINGILIELSSPPE